MNSANRLDIQPGPGPHSALDIQGVVEEFAVRTLVTQLSWYYGEGVQPRHVHPNLQKMYVSLLGDMGFSTVGKRALNPMLDYPSWDDIAAPHIDKSPKEVTFIIGPPGVEGTVNPAEVYIYARTEKYWEAREGCHIDTKNGYSLDTIPEQVPWDEKLSLVANPVRRDYVPRRTFVGIDSGVDYAVPPRSVEDLARIAGAYPKEVDELLDHVSGDNYVVGPVPKLEKDGSVYSGLQEGPAISFWGPADLSEGVSTEFKTANGLTKVTSKPSIDGIRLERLKLALANNTIVPSNSTL